MESLMSCTPNCGLLERLTNEKNSLAQNRFELV